jgi:hypothetical protein
MKTPRATPPKTDCHPQPLLFEELGPRPVRADFSGGYHASDGGALLLRQIDCGLGLTRTLAEAFPDGRDPRDCDHTLPQLLTQRLCAQALGYEAGNDHDTIRHDPLLALACDKADPLGRDRLHAADAGVALAGSATRTRLELGNHRHDRTHQITHAPARIEATLLTMGVRCLDQHARELIVDLDTMGHLVHGLHEGRHFNAYYDGYCYLPLYAFVGAVPLWAQLRPGASDAAAGVVPALEKIIAARRRRCKKARRSVRGASAFAREESMAWCETQSRVVYYCLGLAGKARLLAMLPATLAAARARRCLTGAPRARAFADLEYQTLQRWRRKRRVVAKAEVLAAGGPTCRRTAFAAKTGNASARRGSTKKSIAGGARWKTCSSNKCWICPPPGSRRIIWAATNCGSGWRRGRTCGWNVCAAWGCTGPNWHRRPWGRFAPGS